jgi:hypothetical protein
MSLRKQPEYADLVVWTVLDKSRLTRLEKMVGDRSMPVLLDVPEMDVKMTYGITTARSHLLFDRTGCLRAFEDLPPSKTIQNSPELLLAYLDQMR